EDKIIPLAEVERRTIFQALDVCGENRTKAATKLGISLRTLRNKVKGYERVTQEKAERPKKKARR
ncbi:MAG: helix-turn-helix domain-containing protein, partial [Deltaproteobacteria bacterium]|nr:helix-turn-helix domain-containing protein [Deltaproteobacteria bacterium]